MGAAGVCAHSLAACNGCAWGVVCSESDWVPGPAPQANGFAPPARNSARRCGRRGPEAGAAGAVVQRGVRRQALPQPRGGGGAAGAGPRGRRAAAAAAVEQQGEEGGAPGGGQGQPLSPIRTATL